MQHNHEIHVVQPGGVHHLNILDLNMNFLIRTNDSTSKLAVMEWSLPPNSLGAPPHVHLADDEVFYVLEGELTVWEEGVVTAATSGTSVLLERGRLHTFWNASDKPMKALVMLAPGHLEGFFVAASPLFNSDPMANMEAINRAAAEHQLELRMDLVPEIMQKYGLGSSLPEPNAPTSTES